MKNLLPILFVLLPAFTNANTAPVPHDFPRVTKDLEAFDFKIAQLKDAFNKKPKEKDSKEYVKRRISHLVEIDQAARFYGDITIDNEYTDKEQDFFWREFGPKLSEIDTANTSEMKELLKKVTWFKISEYGQKTDNDAWLLVQHADHDVAFQKQVLAILTELYPKKETSPSNYAYLWDRVAAINEKRPQRYGTQGRCVGPGKWEPHQIEDAANVDKRRAEMGLESMDAYKGRFNSICRGKS